MSLRKKNKIYLAAILFFAIVGGYSFFGSKEHLHPLRQELIKYYYAGHSTAYGETDFIVKKYLPYGTSKKDTFLLLEDAGFHGTISSHDKVLDINKKGVNADEFYWFAVDWNGIENGEWIVIQAGFTDKKLSYLGSAVRMRKF